MPRCKLLITILAFLILCSPVLLQGQELAGTLNGTVTDPSGAVIPSATVTIEQNNVNGVSRTIQTDAHGNYTVTNLAPGNYTVMVTANGFRAYTARDVTLFVAQTRSVDAKLQPGTVSQTVTVQQSAVALDTTTSALADTISETQIKELQLNNRNFEQLVILQPGVVSQLGPEPSYVPGTSDAILVNGARASANNWTVDGADINDSGSNLNILNVPSVDAIQEFTLERSGYDAQYGRSGGGQVLVSTKSGTSAFHGDAYEFNRNNIFNANNYFNKQTTPVTPRAIERYNDFGFTLGGPLYIPKVYNTAKNKTFLFWSEEWRKVTSPVTQSYLVPTQNELNGVFPGQITGAPAGCVAYDAGADQSTINPSCYSQNAKVYLTNVYDKFAPNSPNGQYVTAYSQGNNSREDIVRIDYNISQKLHFYARGMQDEAPQILPTGYGGGFPGVSNASTNSPGQNVVGNLIWTISPRMVNEAEFAFSQGELGAHFLSGVIADSPAVADQLTNNYVYRDPYGRIPQISFVNSIQGFVNDAAPYYERNLDRTIFDNFSLTLGKHTLRTGASISQMLKNENGSVGFPSFLFNDFPSFLFGNVLSYTQNSEDIAPDLHYKNFEAYVQDDWHVTRSLTLNLGLRYSYFPSPEDVKNFMNNFDPLIFDQNKAPAIDPDSGNFAVGGQVPATYVNGIIFPAGKACNQAQAIAPGVTCSSYGSHVNPDRRNNVAPRIGFAYAPYGYNKIAIHGGFGIFYDRVLNAIWEDNTFNPPVLQTATINNTSFDDPLQGALVVPLSPNTLYSTGNPAMKTPSYMDFNFSVQVQPMPNTVAQVAYVGTLGRHLLGQRDLNQPTLGQRVASPNSYVTAVVPYGGYSSIGAILSAYYSNYNALQVSVNHRTQHGLTLGVAYTWGKSLTNESNDRFAGVTYDTYNPSLDYGPMQGNQPQTFVANYVYDLPFYKGQHGIVGHMLGGWELSGITQFISGQSSAVTQAADNFDCQTPASGVGCIPGTYPGGINMDLASINPRPDRIAPVHMLKKQSEWFSTASFADAIGHFGNSPNGVLLGPGLELWDLAAMKNFNLGEDRRLQFRGEFFNAFNHTNFSGVDMGIDDGSYGQVTSAQPPREIQLGGKFYF